MEKAPESSDTMARADRYMFQTYGRFPITLVKGDGCRVWDETGKEYLDFVAGIAVCSLGHSSPVVTQALSEQAKELFMYPICIIQNPRSTCRNCLLKILLRTGCSSVTAEPKPMKRPLKLARRYSLEKSGSDRHVIVSMKNSFHGRTMATLSATGQEKIQKGYDPLLQGFRFVPFNDLKRA